MQFDSHWLLCNFCMLYGTSFWLYCSWKLQAKTKTVVSGKLKHTLLSLYKFLEYLEIEKNVLIYTLGSTLNHGYKFVRFFCIKPSIVLKDTTGIKKIPEKIL